MNNKKALMRILLWGPSLIGIIIIIILLNSCAIDSRGNFASTIPVSVISSVNITVSDNHTNATGGVHGVSGELSDKDDLDAHMIDETTHGAPGLILGQGDLDGHAGEAVVHQDAPALIITHSSNETAHHEEGTSYPGAGEQAFLDADHSKLDGIASGATVYTDGDAQSASVSDTVYGVDWNGVTTIAPSKNAVYDELELLSESGVAMAAGSYTGNGIDSRQITTGFLCKFVVIQRVSSDNPDTWLVINLSGADAIFIDIGASPDDRSKPYLHASNGFTVGTTGDYANTDGILYKYVAFG